MGRTFAVRFDHGEDFFAALSGFCAANDVRQAFIPMFIAGFREIELVATCDQVRDLEAPVWSSVTLESVEALGGGTLAYDQTTRDVLPHIHVSVGLKLHSARAHTSHLLGAKVQFLIEMYLVEVATPAMRRTPSRVSRRVERRGASPGGDLAAVVSPMPCRATRTPVALSCAKRRWCL
jgi:predicted DNA-binding protein with PD1-like motif